MKVSIILNKCQEEEIQESKCKKCDKYNEMLKLTSVQQNKI